MQKKKQKIWILCLFAGAVLLSVLWKQTHSLQKYRDVRIVEAVNAKVKRQKETLQPHKGMRLSLRDTLMTEEKGHMTLCIDEDIYVYIEENSQVEVVEQRNEQLELHLEKGAMSNELQETLPSNSIYEVTTPNVVMAVRGTVFRAEVYRNKKQELYTDVIVPQGSVITELILPDKRRTQPYTVKAGTGMKIRGDNESTEYIWDHASTIQYDKLSLQALRDFETILMHGKKALIGINLETLRQYILEKSAATEYEKTDKKQKRHDFEVQDNAQAAASKLTSTEQKDEANYPKQKIKQKGKSKNKPLIEEKKKEVGNDIQTDKEEQPISIYRWLLIDRGNVTAEGKMKTGTILTLPQLKRQGYQFLGWSENASSPIYKDSIQFPNDDLQLHAVWKARLDTPYRVHYLVKEKLDKDYHQIKTMRYTGMTDTRVHVASPAYLHYKGYEAVRNETQSEELLFINADGSAEANLYYEYEEKKMEAKQVAVRFIYADKHRKDDAMTMVQGTKLNELPKASEILGYTFQAWNTHADGSGRKIEAGSVINENTIVYEIVEEEVLAAYTIVYQIQVSGDADTYEDIMTLNALGKPGTQPVLYDSAEIPGYHRIPPNRNPVKEDGSSRYVYRYAADLIHTVRLHDKTGIKTLQYIHGDPLYMADCDAFASYAAWFYKTQGGVQVHFGFDDAIVQDMDLYREEYQALPINIHIQRAGRSERIQKMGVQVLHGSIIHILLHPREQLVGYTLDKENSVLKFNIPDAEAAHIVDVYLVYDQTLSSLLATDENTVLWEKNTAFQDSIKLPLPEKEGRHCIGYQLDDVIVTGLIQGIWDLRMEAVWRDVG